MKLVETEKTAAPGAGVGKPGEGDESGGEGGVGGDGGGGDGGGTGGGDVVDVHVVMMPEEPSTIQLPSASQLILLVVAPAHVEPSYNLVLNLGGVTDISQYESLA